ncbi:glycoside hydrolase family 5 protein [Dokdonia sinensis]|uniref:Glycoside hydrolase family 5 protein n=1 Tax=Dokdonia sinensis TaxID=2479847 RepID=A0A3M0FWJ0_9FLAO|nr:glycoside hydrolase family 5 protein [Dokdonia sinensis]RMB57130.1 glycoside hydrolase family 5 protein [Dokdonia sinensis]
MKTTSTLLKYTLIFLFSLVTLGCTKDDSSEVETVGQEEQQEENPPVDTDLSIAGTIRDISSSALVEEMGVGWNLGNSLDVESRDKTAWGNPLPSQAIIDRVYAMGFRTLRIPITWSYNMQSTAPFTIENSYLTTVQKTVNYGISKGMHVIIDVHHDNSWIRPTQTDATAVKARLGSLWTQVANRFKTYGDKLIFETLNENRLLNSPEEWTGGTEEGRAVLNEYHKTALDAIRATGGNNANRHIMISTYAASTLPVAMDGLVIPNNDERVIISLHTYFPWQFTGEEGGVSTWGTDEEKAALEAEFDYIRDKWIIQEQRPVILGEWGARDRNNLNVREDYFQFYVEKSLERGLLPIVWDDGGNFRILNRANLQWHFPTLAETIIEAAN